MGVDTTSREYNLFIVTLNGAFVNPHGQEMRQLTTLIREIKPFDSTIEELNQLSIEEIDWLAQRFVAELCVTA